MERMFAGAMSVRVMAGSYERLLYGMQVIRSDNGEDVMASDAIEAYCEPGSCEFKMIFINNAHDNIITTLSSDGKYLISGSTDEQIKVYHLPQQKEIGSALHHTSTITCSAVALNHLLSGDSNGMICIWKMGQWEPLLSIKEAHGGRVEGICFHPSGKLALSIGSDRILNVWDLTVGKRLTQRALNASPIAISMSRSGSHYAVLFEDKSIMVWGMEDKTKKKVTVADRKTPRCINFMQEDVLLIGCVENTLLACRWEDDEVAWAEDEMNGRVRAIDVFHGDNGKAMIASATSKGSLQLRDENGTLLTSFDLDCRLTCVSICGVQPTVEERPEPKKRKREKIVRVEEPILKKRKVDTHKKKVDTPKKKKKVDTQKKKVVHQKEAAKKAAAKRVSAKKGGKKKGSGKK